MALFNKAKRPNNTVEESGTLSFYGLYAHGVKPNVKVSPSSYIFHSGVKQKKGKSIRNCHPDAIGSPARKSFNVTSTEYAAARKSNERERQRAKKMITPTKSKNLNRVLGISPKKDGRSKKKGTKSVSRRKLYEVNRKPYYSKAEEKEWQIDPDIIKGQRKVESLENELRDSLNQLKYRRYLKEASSARKNNLNVGMKDDTNWLKKKEKKYNFDRMENKIARNQKAIRAQERMDAVSFDLETKESKESHFDEKLHSYTSKKKSDNAEKLSFDLISLLQDEKLRDELSRLLIEKI